MLPLHGVARTFLACRYACVKGDTVCQDTAVPFCGLILLTFRKISSNQMMCKIWVPTQHTVLWITRANRLLVLGFWFVSWRRQYVYNIPSVKVNKNTWWCDNWLRNYSSKKCLSLWCFDNFKTHLPCSGVKSRPLLHKLATSLWRNVRTTNTVRTKNKCYLFLNS